MTIEEAKAQKHDKQLFIHLDKNGNPAIYQTGLTYTELLGLANLLEYLWRLELANALGVTEQDETKEEK